MSRGLRAFAARVRRPVRLLLLLPLCSACVERDGAAGVTTIDEDGTPVVEVRALPPTVEVGSFATIAIAGRGDGDSVPLFRVAGIVTDDAGGIYVANAGSHEILALDAAGALRWRAGRRGRGPAEFTVVGGLQLLPGDTIAAIDSGRNLVSWWDSAGRFIDATVVRPPTLAADEAALFSVPGVLVAVLDDRRAVVRGPGSAPAEGRPGVRNVNTQIHVLADTAPPSAHFVLPGPDVYELRTPGTMRALLAPMSGATAITAAGNLIAWARSDRYEVVLHDADGTTARVLRVAEAAEPVSAAVRREYLGGWRPWFDVQEPIPLPAAVPTFDRVFTARDGRIWARRYHWGDRAERWILFTARESATHQYSFPARLQVLAANGSAAFGIFRDSLDVEHLVRAPLPTAVR